MKLLDYLGRRMKDDEVMRLLERFEMQVIYQFDRHHESTPDYYDCKACDAGFALRFDDAQVITTIFCYLVPSEGFQPVERSFITIRGYFRCPRCGQLFSHLAWWTKLRVDSSCVHCGLRPYHDA